MASTAKPQSKTALACDRCRQRKSRDKSTLSRLADAEARIQALEAQYQHGRISQAQARTGLLAAESAESEIAQAPSFHTASAHQMIHSWPRLRLCLASHGNPLHFLADADGREPLFGELTQDINPGAPESLSSSHLLQNWQVMHVLESFDAVRDRLPLTLRILLDACNGLGQDSVLQLLGSTSRTSIICPTDLSLQHAILIHLAITCMSFPDLSNQQATASVYFKSVLDRQWMLWNTVHERIAISAAIAYCLVNNWARPLHALGALQSAMPSLERMAMRAKDDPHLATFARLYYIIQSDILTEVDEYSSDTILSDHSSKLVAIFSSNPSEAMRPPGTSPSQVTTISENKSNSDSILWLRSHMNKILSLYTPVRAYARPHQLKDLVFRFSEDLRIWYQSLPMEMQFPRDIMTFTIHGDSFHIDNDHKDLALRYFACIFFLHRPVLYFFLHKDMEYAIQPPLDNGAASDHSPWVWESCRDCIESAALIIQISQRRSTENPYNTLQYWPQYQLLFASYVTLLQVRTQPSLEPYLRVLGNMDRLLDIVEEVFRTKTRQEPLIQRSLLLLVDARHNLDNSSPASILSARSR